MRSSYAHDKGVTLVAALGNDHDDISEPAARESRARTTRSTPSTPARSTTRTASTCRSRARTSSASRRSARPSARPTTPTGPPTCASGELEVSAPGGWFRDGFGTDTYRTNGNLILSTAPLNVMQAEGQVDADGNVTPAGEALGTMKDCGKVKGTRSAGTTSTSRAPRWRHRTPPVSPRWRCRPRAGRRAGSGFGLSPDTVRQLLLGTATTTPARRRRCRPTPTWAAPPSYDALCTGTTGFNSFYGAASSTPWEWSLTTHEPRVAASPTRSRGNQPVCRPLTRAGGIPLSGGRTSIDK